MTNFNTLGISREILFNLNNLKLTNPTPIQKKAIIPALEGKDILANAKTGTGKTAAFGIPLIQKLNENELKNSKKIRLRKFTLKNFFRKIFQIFLHLVEILNHLQNPICPNIFHVTSQFYVFLLYK